MALDRLLADAATDFRIRLERLAGPVERPVRTTDRRQALAALDAAIASVYGERRGDQTAGLSTLITDETTRLWGQSFAREGERLQGLLDDRDLALATAADPDIALLVEMERYTIARRTQAAKAFDDTRKWVDPNGYRLDDRVWRARQEIRRAIDARLRAAIFEGTNARTLARDLERFLTPVAAAGRSTTRSGSGRGSHAARRLARTEITRALGQSTIEAAKRNPMVRGIRWRLSGSHPKDDECNIYATQDLYALGPGVYPVDRVPTYPAHPHDLCGLVPSVPPRDEAIAEIRRKYRLDVSDEEFALRGELTARLESLTTGPPIRVEPMDVRSVSAWPTKRSDTAEITRGRRDHYLRRHPEMKAHHADVVDALRDPDIVRRDPDRPDRALLYRRRSGEQWILVVVEMRERTPRNLLITAHLISERSLIFRGQTEPTVWEREG